MVVLFCVGKWEKLKCDKCRPDSTSHRLALCCLESPRLNQGLGILAGKPMCFGV